jgi:hypothetical protein
MIFSLQHRASKPFVLIFAVILLFSFLAPVIEVSVATRTSGLSISQGAHQAFATGVVQWVKTWWLQSILAVAYLHLLLAFIRIKLPGLILTSTIPTRLRQTLLRPLKFTSFYYVMNLHLSR